MDIRTEAPGDHSAIRRVHLDSFPDPSEADLVDRLREDGDAIVSLVAVEADSVVGHVVFSAMTAPFRALGLGPVAVLPGCRRQGVAARLIEEGLARARDGGWDGVFVLGDPAYYDRFGFSAATAEGFASPYAGPYLMALPLGGETLPVTTGAVDYAPAFAGLPTA